jgi:hypothetical protein
MCPTPPTSGFGQYRKRKHAETAVWRRSCAASLSVLNHPAKRNNAMLKAHSGIADVASQQRPLLPPSHALETLWPIALGELKQQMTKATFNAWLVDSRVVPEASSPVFLVVAVRNQYAYEWLTYRLQLVIVRTLSSLAGYQVVVCFIPRSFRTMRRSCENEPTRRPPTRLPLPIQR